MATATATAPADLREILLESANLSLDQLPMLPIVLDRLGTQIADQLRRVAPSPAHVTLNGTETARIGELLDAYEMNAIAAVYRVAAWDSQILIGFDRDFVFTMVEALFGGDGSEAPFEQERAFTSIETQVAQFLFEQVATAFQSAFALVGNIRLKHERTETRMNFAMIGRRSNPVVVARFLLQAINRGGEMFVVVPQAALARSRQALSRVVMSEEPVRDPGWMQQISNQVQKTEVTIRAVIELPEITLGEIAALKVGEILKLPATPKSRIKVESSDQPLFWSYLGQAEGFHTLCIDEVIDQEREFVNDVLSR